MPDTRAPKRPRRAVTDGRRSRLELVIPGRLLIPTAVRAGLIREQLAHDLPLRLGVAGWSMFPAVPPGSIVTLAAIPPGGLARGDVVVVEAEGRMVCHAVADVLDGRIRTRGFASPVDDPPAPLAALVGLVVAVSVGPFTLRAGSLTFRSVMAVARLTGRPGQRLALAAWTRLPPGWRRALGGAEGLP
jgi:hypothetical protein